MEATFKIVLDKRFQKQNGTYPLSMRIFQDRKYKAHPLHIDLRVEDWDNQLQQVKPCNPNYKTHNVKILMLKAQVQKSILIGGSEDTIITPDEIVSQINQKSIKPAQKIKPDILEYGNHHVVKLKKGGFIGIT